MYLRRYIKSVHLLVYRQKCVNWCQLVANRRHFADDSDKDNDKSVTIKEDNVVDNASHKRDSTGDDGRRKSDDKVVVAKHNLNELIQTLKSKDIFGKPDDKLREVLAKPVFHIKKSARKEVPIEDTIKEDINEISGDIDERLVLAAKGIARTLKGEESKKTERDLLKLLKLQIIETNYAKSGQTLPKEELASLLGKMKVLKEEPKSTHFIPIAPQGRNNVPQRERQYSLSDELFDEREGRQEFRQKPRPFGDRREKPYSLTDELFDLSGKEREFSPRRRPFGDRRETDDAFGDHRVMKPSRQKSAFLSQESHNLFSGESIGIFEADMKEATDAPKMLIWDRLLDDELHEAVAQPPKNMFEEMIQWTEEGKLWKYPINNEQGLEEEEKVPFYEHVLLDHLLEGFPDSGPVKKFMDLVVIGLSSNPYITVERKHATIQYYKQYFNEKQDMLETAGVLAKA